MNTNNEELNRCANDFVYFCENYVQIKHPVHGTIPFKLQEFQKRYVNFISTPENLYVICKKFRQGGFSTIALAWSLWTCLFKFDQRVLHISKTDREAINCGYVFKDMMSRLPKWMLPTLGQSNHHEKSFDDTGSKILFYTPEAARGKAATHLILDEPAFISNMDAHWKAMYPVICAGGRCIATSSVNGTGNWFHQTYRGAEKGENSFKIFECKYSEHSDYGNEEWVEKVNEQLGPKSFKQEVLCEFGDENIAA